MIAQQHGVLILNKPKGPTSAHCLRIIKRTLNQAKIGHAGTLDPMAQGLLIVLLGKATKLSDYLMTGRKTYLATAKLGIETDSYDAEGTILNTYPTDKVLIKDIENTIVSWRGKLVQEVPPVSAVKHKGVPFYKLQRSGQEVPLKIREIEIFDAQLVATDLPYLRFRIVCSAGTYIRSLAHSLGKRLQCGAHLTELTREASSPFSLDMAHSLDDLESEKLALYDAMIPLANCLPHWEKIYLDENQLAFVRNGRSFPANQMDSSFCLALNKKGEAIALLKKKCIEQNYEWTILRGLWD